MSGTPTMAEVRHKYATVLDDTAGWRHSPEWGHDFDRWLLAHDAEVRRVAAVEALTQAAEALDDLKLNPANDDAPYLIREYNDGLTSAAEEVRDRATKIGGTP